MVVIPQLKMITMLNAYELFSVPNLVLIQLLNNWIKGPLKSIF